MGSDDLAISIIACGNLAGKIVVDCTNPLAPNLGGLTIGHADSAGKAVARWATGAKVIKALNTTTARSLGSWRPCCRTAAMERGIEKYEHEDAHGSEGCCGGSQGAARGRQKGKAMMDKMMGDGDAEDDCGHGAVVAERASAVTGERPPKAGAMIGPRGGAPAF